MDTNREPNSARILVIARPELGRAVTIVLAAAGYEVYRSPDAAEVATTVKRLRPDLVIIALDLPWYDGEAAAGLVRDLDHPVPIVLLDHTSPVGTDGASSVHAGDIDGHRLLNTVAGFLTDPLSAAGEDDRLAAETMPSVYATCKRALAAAGTLRGEGREAMAILARTRAALA